MATPTDSNIDKLNNLSDASKNLLQELQEMSIKASNLISRLYVSLRNDGLTPMEARKIIEERIDVSQRTLRRALPEEAKQVHKKSDKMSDFKGNQNDYLSTNAKFADKMSASNAKLILDKKPDIPAPEQPIIAEFPSAEEIAAEIAITPAGPTVITSTPVRKHENADMPLPFAKILNGRGPKSLTALIGWAETNGEKSIRFTINDQGELYLKT